jgi:hypothetical protein
MKRSSSPPLQLSFRPDVVAMRRLVQTFDFCVAVLFVLIVSYAAAVAIHKTADRAAARNVFDALVHDTCAHPVVHCRVT